MIAVIVRRWVPAALLILVVGGPAWGQTVPADTTVPPAPVTVFPGTLPAAQLATLGGDQSATRPYRPELSVYFGAPPLR